MLYYPDKLKSNNPKAYGVVDATEVSGHCTAKTLEDLYAMPDALLSVSGTNADNDAIGKVVYVTGAGDYYKLTDWSKRASADGWTVFAGGSGGTATDVESISDSEIEGLF